MKKLSSSKLREVLRPSCTNPDRLRYENRLIAHVVERQAILALQRTSAMPGASFGIVSRLVVPPTFRSVDRLRRFTIDRQLDL
jgi:hypothetical protein